MHVAGPLGIIEHLTGVRQRVGQEEGKLVADVQVDLQTEVFEEHAGARFTRLDAGSGSVNQDRDLQSGRTLGEGCA